MKQLNSKNYTLNQSEYQLILPLDVARMIPSDDNVRLLSQFVEELDLTALYRTYAKVRKSSADPKQMLKVVLYAFMNRLFSSRDIETACRRDINFLFLLEGAPAPDHSTIARFKYLHFAPVSKVYLAAMSEWLFCHGEISGHDIFIDGTKIESCANKYTFVWKKAVTKSLLKLQTRALDFVAECEEIYGLQIVRKGEVSLHTLKRLRKKLYKLKQEEGIPFVYGAGHRKSRLQKSVEALEEMIDKFKEYNQKLHVCGDRNSYSKTDPDATFMRMKEDAMRNGQLAFIKPTNYEISRIRKYKADPGRRENMTYDPEADEYTCQSGRKLSKDGVIHKKSSTGYYREITRYSCKDCSGCSQEPIYIR